MTNIYKGICILMCLASAISGFLGFGLLYSHILIFFGCMFMAFESLLDHDVMEHLVEGENMGMLKAIVKSDQNFLDFSWVVGFGILAFTYFLLLTETFPPYQWLDYVVFGYTLLASVFHKIDREHPWGGIGLSVGMVMIVFFLVIMR
jgi:hypothetical protein